MMNLPLRIGGRRLFAAYVPVIAATVAGGSSLLAAIRSIGTADVYRKDILQEYLLGTAVREGVNPYLALPELAADFLGVLPYSMFPHATPHPPPVFLLGLPLTAFDYPEAAGVWLIIQIGCIFASLCLLLRHMGPKPTPLILGLVTLAFIGTDAVFYELALGQLQSLMLLLLVLAWLALRARRDGAGGASLGVAMALKFMGWPILLFLAVQRRWRAVSAALLMAVLLNGVAAIAMGIGTVIDFYLYIAPQVTSLYRCDPGNIALSSIGCRVFGGTRSVVFTTLSAPPILSWDLGAGFLWVAVPALFALWSVFAAHKIRTFDGAFALLVCASALVNPIAWNHYCLLAAMALTWIWRCLFLAGFPRLETGWALAATMGLFLPNDLLHEAAIMVSRGIPTPGQSVMIPFSASLITLFPTVVLAALCILVWRIGRSWDGPADMAASTPGNSGQLGGVAHPKPAYSDASEDDRAHIPHVSEAISP